MTKKEAPKKPQSSPDYMYLGKDHKRKIKHICEFCDYTTSKISNLKKHFLSKKHIKNMQIRGFQKRSPKNDENNKKHKKNEEEIYLFEKNKEEIYLFEKNKELAKKVEALEKKLVEQKVEALEEQLKLKDETINAYQKGRNITNNNNNNYKDNTFNTNNISINMFLNEKCKNAMNLTDFVNQIKVQLEDVIYTQKHGPERGITNILVKQLEDVPITERPIHCADIKRKKFYVKDNHEWKKTQPSKEMNGDKGPIERCIRNLKSKQHLVMETEWKNKNPDHETNPEKKDEYLDIENKIWKGCAKGESWSDYMKTMEKDIAEWSLPSLKEEMDEVNKKK